MIFVSRIKAFLHSLRRRRTEPAQEPLPELIRTDYPFHVDVNPRPGETVKPGNVIPFKPAANGSSSPEPEKSAGAEG